ncbi:uncharacterized protein LOC114477762 isoform X2 [Gouania willdenowi]|uniref:uncharacterized protein LOC114477762 isoform X2 n=1 Tax=Gouania willdenowi TaxID=441366 RepID=UPI00105465C2|nr:uncharacterized protein LOC114477762 isoform X2 [Gouania willdenowi]
MLTGLSCETMGAVWQPRRVLVEIPAPQPKSTARVRRSYLEILSARIAPSPLRTSNQPGNAKRSQSHFPVGGVLRARLDDRPTALSTQQLVQLFRSLVLVELNKEPRAVTSDMKHLQDELQLKKTNVFRSIPYSRFCSNRDAHCYRKAYPHLVAFKVSCEEWGRVLLRKRQWDQVLEHSLMAWRLTSELPRWDTESHNVLREQCYGVLTSHILTALRHHRPTDHRGRELLIRLKNAELLSHCMAPCVQELQKILQSSSDQHDDAAH